MGSVISNFGSYTNSLQSQLKLARDALLAQQTALNTVSHNVANVNTEGYHRQRTVLETRLPKPSLDGMMGSGVQVAGIERSYHAFISRQERTETGILGRWEMQRDMLGRVEEVMNEVGGNRVGSALDEFWNAWEDLANDADSKTSRINLIIKADDLGTALSDTYNSLDKVREEINIHMRDSGNQINDLATRIADLNEKIYTVVSRKQSPNDLMDQRDQLVKELAKIANITTQEESNGSMTVYLGNETLVTRNSTRQVEWQTDTSGELGKSGGNLIWSDSEHDVQLHSGQLYGDLQARSTINQSLADLDTLADSIRSNVNALHREGIARDGTTGNDFFRSDVTGASSLEVAQELRDSPNKLAASRTSATGDSGLAHEMYNLQFDKAMNDGESTYADFYQSIVTNIGSQVANARTRADAADAGLKQTENWQQQYTGVNLDEEMSNMVSIQYAFTAASKLAGAVDEMMKQIVNGFAR